MSNRTRTDVEQDLETLRREMDVVMAEVNLSSAKVRLHGPGTTKSAEVESAHYEALRRYGELDTRREQLQAEARALRAPDGSASSLPGLGTTYKLRAEDWSDLVQVADALMPRGGPLKCESFSTRVSWEDGLPGFEMTVSSSRLALDDLLDVISDFPNSHVMYETIQPIDLYTGERERDRGSSKPAGTRNMKGPPR